MKRRATQRPPRQSVRPAPRASQRPAPRSSTQRRPGRAALRQELRRRAREMADRLIEILDEQGMWDEPAAASRRVDVPKRVRRSADALDKLMARIVSDLKTRSDAVSIGEVATKLGLTSRQIAHPMSLLVDEGKVVRSGERRGARYQLPSRRRRGKRRR